MRSLCLTPEELETHMGAYKSYCPVSLTQRRELVDCSVDEQYTYVAEHKAKYYRFLSKADLDTFLNSPHEFVPPEGKDVLPPPEMRPKILTEVDKSMFPKEMELQGFCAVTYVTGGCM